MKFDDAPFKPYASISADSQFVDSPATRRRDADLIGGRGYSIDFAGEGTSEAHWDFLMSMARLLQLPDLFTGEWLNSGGHYNRQTAEWFNREGVKGIPISILRDVVVGRIVELGLDGGTTYRYVTRRGRTIAEEEAFYRLPFDERMNALRSGEAL